MKKILIFVFLSILTVKPQPAKADMWGADIPILLEILAQNINQLYQMYELVQKSQDSIDLVRQINDGITQAIATYNRLRNLPNAGLYDDWQSVSDAIRKLQQIYGSIPVSENSTVQSHSDQAIAEAVSMNTQLFAYADDLEQIGQEIQSLGGQSSPKGAAQLTAQGMGVMLRAMNQTMRAQASALKLQAQSLAVENKKEKDETRAILGTSAALSKNLKNHNSVYQTPRF